MGLWIAANMLFTMTEEQREQIYCEMNDIDYDGWVRSMNDSVKEKAHDKKLFKDFVCSGRLTSGII